jgi:hypothetical protein
MIVGAVKAFGPHQRARRLGSLQASQICFRGASNSRLIMMSSITMVAIFLLLSRAASKKIRPDRRMEPFFFRQLGYLQQRRPVAFRPLLLKGSAFSGIAL